MKAYTDLNQSKKLAEILPLESADMAYLLHSTSDNPTWRYDEDMPPMVLGNVPINELTCDALPCWSLAALLDVLPKGTNISTPKPINALGYCCWNQYDEIYSDNPVDACYEMVLKLHKLKLL